MVIVNILVLSVAVFLVSRFLPGIRIKNFMTAVIVAIVYSIINFLIGWLLVILTLPFIIISFGFFKFVINAFLLWLTDKIIKDFEIKGLFTTFIAAFFITLVDLLIKWIL